MSNVYDLVQFHRMLVGDALRMERYRAAIFKVVKPGDVVLDLGCGSGVLSFFACQAGAARVYAVERSAILDLAQELAIQNGFGDRIQFLRQDIRTLALDRSVNVIVSELISKALLGQNMLELVALCRDRFLVPGGVILPSLVDLHVAPVEAPSSFEQLRWPDRAIYNLDFSTVQTASLNALASTRVEERQLLAAPQRLFQYEAHRTSPMTIEQTFLFEFHRDGMVHGFVSWFDATLVEEIRLTNAPPGIPSWDNGFFPLENPIAIRAGMVCVVEFLGRESQDGPPFWSWSTEIWEDATKRNRLASFQQSTFLGIPLSVDRLQHLEIKKT